MSFFLIILLYSQLLQMATVGAAPTTTPNSFLLDHTVLKKTERTLHRQAAGAEYGLHPISRAAGKTVSISQRNTNQAFSVRKKRSDSNFPALPASIARSALPQIKITSGVSTPSNYIFTSTLSDSTTMSQYSLISQFSPGGVSEWGLISFPFNENVLENKLHDGSPFSFLVSLPTTHPLTDKEMQAFQEKLKSYSTKNPQPKNHNASNPLLKQQRNEKSLVTISDLPYIGPVAAPLAQWVQSGSLSNASLTSQQLGLSGPLSGGVTYSNVTDVFLNAQYILPLADQAALGLLGEYGSGQYRLNGTVAYGFSSLSQIKVGGEYLVQRLPFQFDSGNVMQRLHQSAYGVRFQQLFEQPYWQNINLGAYYARAANKDLPSAIFSVNGLSYLNERRIAGASSSGIDVGTEVLLSPKTLLSGNVYFDSVYYDTKLTGDISQNRQGLGGGIKIKQLFGGNFKLWGEVSVRKIYDSYEGGVSWLPAPKQLGLEFGVLAQHVVFHNNMPSNNNLSLQAKWLPDTNPHYDEYFNWEQKCLPTVSQWVKTPAVYMPQVLAVAEQITRLFSVTITAINPNNGPTAGGNTVTITGSNFVNGLMVFFGGQLASVIELLSPTTLTVEAPGITGSLTPQAVDVVIEAPDGQQAILSDGYTYNSLPGITSIVPPKGPTVGGTLVTLTGSNFTGATSVTFGRVLGTNVSVNSGGTELTVNAPAGTAGAVDVVVSTPGGSSPVNPPATTYTYVAVPTVTGINPSSGPMGDQHLVKITGTGFLPLPSQPLLNLKVTFGGQIVETIVVESDTEMLVKPPLGGFGAVDVVVTTSGGSSPVNPPATTYTYLVVVPTVTGISPSSGPLINFSPVTISGTGFIVGQTTVTFGGQSANSLVTYDTEMLAWPPPSGCREFRASSSNHTERQQSHQSTHHNLYLHRFRLVGEQIPKIEN